MGPAVINPGADPQKVTAGQSGIRAVSRLSAFRPQHTGHFPGDLGRVLVMNRLVDQQGSRAAAGYGGRGGDDRACHGGILRGRVRHA